MKTIETKVINVNLGEDIDKGGYILRETIKDANTGDELRIDGKHEGFVFGRMVISKLGDKIIAKNYRRDIDILTKETHPILYEILSGYIEEYSQAIKNSDEGGTSK